MKIYLGTDHRGYKIKESIFQWLVDKGFSVEDYGAYEFIASDDYTLYAEKVASVVASNKDYFGILFCGSGVGMVVTANKFDNIRASLGKEVDQVKAGRCDDDMNVLVIATDFTSEENTKEMIEAFLETKFDGEERHIRRLEDIRRIEANN